MGAQIDRNMIHTVMETEIEVITTAYPPTVSEKESNQRGGDLKICSVLWLLT